MTSFENLSSTQKIRAALHRDVRNIGTETCHFLGLEITKPALEIVAELVYKKLMVYGTDLEAFAKHAKRSTINSDDVKLLVRRCPSLVLCALLFYANGDYQRVVGVANHFSQEAISRYISEVTSALNHPRVINKFIKFPNSREAREQIKRRFLNYYGIPGVVGCIDGSHFRIFKPRKEEEHLNYCRKHYHSLNIQMVCDDECRILSINAKFGGASHDAFIWENSNLNSYMQTLHQAGESAWLLGDSGYPQRPWLMTPYTNPATGSAAEVYNNVHSRARVLIENTFGRLKNRWRCVCKDRVLHYKPEKCAQIIMACCVLHNIALDFGVPLPEDELNVGPAFQREEVPQQADQSLFITLGRLVRDRLANNIYESQTS